MSHMISKIRLSYDFSFIRRRDRCKDVLSADCRVDCFESGFNFVDDGSRLIER